MLKPSILAFLLIGAPYCLRSAQSPQESWDNLSHLRAGEGLEIVDAKMKFHRGNFTTYTQEGISLRGNGREMTIPRAEVASVRRFGESHRRRNALLGLAIGTAGGFAVGLIRGKTYHEEGETSVFIVVWTPIGASIGAATGAVLPARSEVTVYRATVLRR